MPGPARGPLAGMGRNMAAQSQQAPGWGLPQQRPDMPGQWGAQSTAALRGMGAGLGAQAWGDPGQGAPVITNPSQGQGPQANAFQQAAQQYAAQQRPQMAAQDDPRFRGAVR